MPRGLFRRPRSGRLVRDAIRNHRPRGSFSRHAGGHRGPRCSPDGGFMTSQVPFPARARAVLAMGSLVSLTAAAVTVAGSSATAVAATTPAQVDIYTGLHFSVPAGTN